jgi:hypothetical protein
VADTAVVGIAEQTASGVKDTVSSATKAVTDVIDSSAAVVSESAKAAEKTAALMTKLPDIAEKITTGLSDPTVLMDAAKKSQLGGSFNTQMPSSFSTVLLFSVGLLAFGGYTAYTLRKTFNKSKSEEKNDTPPVSRAV